MKEILLISLLTLGNAGAEELKCLADNIYYEARGESFTDQLVIAKVTLNRVKSKYYPNTICGVVYQRRQFEWTNKKGLTRDPKTWDNIAYLAKTLLRPGVRFLEGFEATHYHANYVSPDWSNLEVYAIVGTHIFYYDKYKTIDWR